MQSLNRRKFIQGGQMVSAARKYNRIVQTGTQCRSNLGEAVRYLHDGHIGKIKLARGLCYKPRGSIGNVNGPQPVPRSVNFDLWCGPADQLPLRRQNLHYDWHWVWETGNGDLGNQGIHQMDIARWALGVQTLAPAVFSIGGRFGYIDNANTANTQFVYHDYPDAPLIFEVRGLNTGAYQGKKIGVIIECENGSMVIPSYTEAIVYDQQGKEVKRFEHEEDHFANFIKAVRSRKVSALNADIQEGHLSSALCHTGNLSHRVGYKSSPNEIRESLQENHRALETYQRMAEHLAENKIDIAKERLTLGAFLQMDTTTERFTNNEAANYLLTRNYRAPFIVPDRI